MEGKERHVLFLEGKSLLDGMKIKYVPVVPYIFTSKIKNKKNISTNLPPPQAPLPLRYYFFDKICTVV